MNTIAEEITLMGRSINDTYIRASKKSIKSYINWKDGAEIFTFEDKSEMKFCENMTKIFSDTQQSLNARLYRKTISPFGDEC